MKELNLNSFKEWGWCNMTTHCHMREGIIWYSAVLSIVLWFIAIDMFANFHGVQTCKYVIMGWGGWVQNGISAVRPCLIRTKPRRIGSQRDVKTFNSLVPGKFEWNYRYVIFQGISVIDGWGISCEIALIWMSLDFTDDQSTLVQVMAWCRQATSHYLSQC